MSLYEYDEARVRRLLEKSAREDGWEEGMKEGKKEGIKESVLNLHRKGYASNVIADLLEVSIQNVQQWIAANESTESLAMANRKNETLV